MDNKEKWHIGKEIPLTLVFLILIQTAGGIWWAATLTNKLDNLFQQITDIKAERYTKIDSQRDIGLLNLKIEQSNKDINELSKRLNNLEYKKK